MSGGSYQYAYQRIQDMAEELQPTTPLRQAFAEHLVKVAKACHHVEWVDSGDYKSGDEDQAIRDCLGQKADLLVLSAILRDAKRVQNELSAAIDAAAKLKLIK